MRTIFCVSYMRIEVPMSLISVTESLDSDIERDSDISASSRKQLRSSVIVVTSDSETSATSRQFL